PRPPLAGDPPGTPPIVAGLDMPGTPGEAVAGPPPPGVTVKVPPIDPPYTSRDWLATIPGRGFHGGVLNGLAAFYAAAPAPPPAPPPVVRDAGEAPAPVAPASPFGPLQPAERTDLITTITTIIEGLYAHLPLKRARYAADPVQRLRRLAREAASLSELDVFYEILRVVTGLRDAHTRYVGPAAWADQVATLPFLVEAYGTPPDDVHYIVSKVAAGRPGIPHHKTSFRRGVEIESWNSVPIDRAVDRYAELETGGRADTRRARALESLTLRALQYQPPPDEEQVVIRYRTLAGAEDEVSLGWTRMSVGEAAQAGLVGRQPGRGRGVDPGREAVRAAKRRLFARSSEEDGRGPGDGDCWPDGWLAASSPELKDVVGARRVRTAHGWFGYLRLWSFDVADDGPYVAEVVRLLGELQRGEGGIGGVIVDLRSNPGGLIAAAERLLQLFGPNPIEPVRFSFLATPLTRAMAAATQNAVALEPWRNSLEDAVETGELYSQAVPMTPPDRCNDIGQVVNGPVIAVVDANTYSAGDLFAAGWMDNDLGPLLTVGEATGGGGANVWWSSDVLAALQGSSAELPALAASIDYTMAVRRATRAAGSAAGDAIEDVGVSGLPYAMTARDLTGCNQDLLERCGQLLAAQLATGMTVVPAQAPTLAWEIRVATLGLDRVELYVDGVQEEHEDVVDSSVVAFELEQTGTQVELRGYASGVLVQRRVLTLDGA
ncbi:MAG TPA: S41 family peptidase, partial [Candidatus Dormibacteraeota bacterium]|nr:S41 family peptidase [Candidatus Dormibacteraeota bacterium]